MNLRKNNGKITICELDKMKSQQILNIFSYIKRAYFITIETCLIIGNCLIISEENVSNDILANPFKFLKELHLKEFLHSTFHISYSSKLFRVIQTNTHGMLALLRNLTR